MIETASGFREAQRLEGSRFAVRQLYQTLAGGSRERPTATLLPKAYFPSTVNQGTPRANTRVFFRGRLASEPSTALQSLTSHQPVRHSSRTRWGDLSAIVPDVGTTAEIGSLLTFRDPGIPLHSCNQLLIEALQSLGNHPCAAKDRHKIVVAYPAGHDMKMHM